MCGSRNLSSRCRAGGQLKVLRETLHLREALHAAHALVSQAGHDGLAQHLVRVGVRVGGEVRLGVGVSGIGLGFHG